MKRVALDTNRLTDLFAGDRALAIHLEHCEEVAIPFAVLGEIRAGFLGGSRTAKNESALRRLLQQDNVSILFPGDETTMQYGHLYVQLKRAGRPIPDNDLWIAALALQHNLTLITRDRHFERIPQLRLG